MSNAFGEVEWGSVEAPQPLEEKKQQQIPFLFLKEGNNKVRLISAKPLQYKRHWFNDASGKPTKVNCSQDDKCPVYIEKTKSVCGGTQGEKAFFLKALDRASGEIKVLDVGVQIINAIGDWVQNPAYGSPTEYDINIVRGKKEAPKKGEPFKPLYTVEAGDKVELSIEEKQLVADSENPNHENFIDLKQRVQPMSADNIQKILSKDSSPKESNTKAPKSGKASFAKATAPVAPATTSTDENFDDIEWDS